MIVIFIVILFIWLSFGAMLFKAFARERQRNLVMDNNAALKPDRRPFVYVYFVPHTKAQIIEILSHKNAGDRLCYAFDKESMVITLANDTEEFYNRSFSGDDYHLSFEEQGKNCILYVEKVSMFGRNSASYVYLRMNEFWEVKVDAAVYFRRQ